MIRRHFLRAATLGGIFALVGCETTNSEWQGIETQRLAQNETIKAEPQGDYFIGRRYYKADYKFWGYVRKPGQPWSTAQMVMLNEQQKLAPDRELGKIGFDNGYEYKLVGNFSGQTVYEPSSNGFYPEFVLKGFEVRSTTPPNIFRNPTQALDPSRRVILKPF
jgi:hypothetical protein